MRDEVTYARDTSTSLPRTSVAFKIMNTSVKPRRIKSAEEFAVGLRIYLGKQADRRLITMKEFKDALE